MYPGLLYNRGFDACSTISLHLACTGWCGLGIAQARTASEILICRVLEKEKVRTRTRILYNYAYTESAA